MMLIQPDLVDVIAVYERPSAEDVILLKPTEAELPSLMALIHAYSRRGDLLPRTEESVRESLADWWVAKTGNTVIACGSLLRYSPKLAEVRSLAVADAAQGLGLGRKVVEKLLKEAEDQSIPTVFALTRVDNFFVKMGFSITDKAFFPEKVWHDCSHCPIQDNCDEIAVVRELIVSQNN